MRIDADYPGGFPSHWDACEAGALTADGGSLRFDGAVMTTSLQTRAVTTTVSQAEIRAISVGDPQSHEGVDDAFVGDDAIFGALGAWIGAASAGRNHLLMVAVQHEGLDYVVSFGVRGDQGAALLGKLQAERRAAGDELLPRVDELGAPNGSNLRGELMPVLTDPKPARRAEPPAGSSRPAGTRFRRDDPAARPQAGLSDVKHRGALEAGLALQHVSDRQASEKL